MKTFLRSKFFFLLISLVVLLLLSPPLEETHFGSAFLTAIFSAVLLSSARVVSDSGKLFAGASILAAFAILCLWVGEASPPNTMWLLGEALYVCLGVLVILIVLKEIVTAEKVDEDVLIGAVSIYLLLGMTWAMLYSFVYGVEPSSFDQSLIGDESFWNDFVYFSFATLTTLGYGDITALSPFARNLSVLEAISGVTFQAIIIARLVSLYRGKQDEPENSAAP